MTQTQNAAEIILQQLGGKRFIAMTGAIVYSDGKNNETLVVRFKGSKKANLLRVTLNDADLYTMEFAKMTGTNVFWHSMQKNVYAEMMQPLFTKTTGLYTSL